MDTQALLMAQIVQASELAKAAQAAGEFGAAAATVGALVVMTGQLLDLTKAPSPGSWTAWEARLDDQARRLAALESTNTLE